MALLLAVAYPVGAPRALAETAPASSTATTPTTPPPKPVYTYDSVTGHWNTQDWVYDAKTGTYQPVIHVSTTPPAGVAVPTPTAPTPPSTSTSTPSTSSSSSHPTGSTNTAATNTTGSATTNAATTNTIGNTVNGTSTSGNAGVTSSTKAGSATTGTADASATLTNLVNTTTSGGAGAPATFTTNVNGNVNGDLVLYPMIMSALLQSAAKSPTTNTANTATTSNTNATANNNVTNNVNLVATSGNATVANNSAAGNATTGNTSAVGNIINMINSAIAAGSSFIGTINIYGNLNGNILISPNFIPSLIASNANTTTNATLSDTSAITNNVKLAAASGSATVADNTNVGSATTGTAKTNVVLLNLTGHQVVAQNSLLVFVNVMGTWVGLIVDAAPGATSAALGTGVTTNAADTTNLNANTNTSITNNLNLAANSGNATVAHNTTAGNATSGNAMAGANILNISQSNIGLSGWFGILFINVFGSWLGSFGVDTPHQGNNPPQVSTSSNAPATSGSVPQAIQFIAHQAVTPVHHPLLHGTTGTQPSDNGDNESSTSVAAAGSSDDHGGMGGPMIPVATTTIPVVVTQPFHLPSTAMSAGTVLVIITLAGISLRRIYGDMATSVLLASS